MGIRLVFGGRKRYVAMILTGGSVRIYATNLYYRIVIMPNRARKNEKITQKPLEGKNDKEQSAFNEKTNQDNEQIASKEKVSITKTNNLTEGVGESSKVDINSEMIGRTKKTPDNNPTVGLPVGEGSDDIASDGNHLLPGRVADKSGELEKELTKLSGHDGEAKVASDIEAAQIGSNPEDSNDEAGEGIASVIGDEEQISAELAQEGVKTAGYERNQLAQENSEQDVNFGIEQKGVGQTIAPGVNQTNEGEKKPNEEQFGGAERSSENQLGDGQHVGLGGNTNGGKNKVESDVENFSSGEGVNKKQDNTQDNTGKKLFSEDSQNKATNEKYPLEEEGIMQSVSQAVKKGVEKISEVIDQTAAKLGLGDDDKKSDEKNEKGKLAEAGETLKKGAETVSEKIGDVAASAAVMLGLHTKQLPRRVYVNMLGEGLSGFDAVAFFVNRQAVKGDASNTYEWQGAQYLFQSRDNMEQFKESPESYLPQFGGYCAYAVSNGEVMAGDPEIWKIIDGKLYLNGSEKEHEKFIAEVDSIITRAESHWQKLLSDLEKKQNQQK